MEVRGAAEAVAVALDVDDLEATLTQEREQAARAAEDLAAAREQLAQNDAALVEAGQHEAAMAAAASEEAARVDAGRIGALETRVDALVAAEASASQRATTAKGRLVAAEAPAERATDEVRVERERMAALQGQHEQDLATQAALSGDLRVALAAAAAAVERVEQVTQAAEAERERVERAAERRVEDVRSLLEVRVEELQAELAARRDGGDGGAGTTR